MVGLEEFRLSSTEFEYLKRLVSRDESLASLIKLEGGVPGPKVSVRLSRVEAERLRDRLTTLLAAVGFDENYVPNEQGRMLEELIDRFYVS